MKTLLALLTVGLHAFVDAAHIDPPAAQVYWSSPLPPADIFRRGIDLTGGNDNLQQTALGATCDSDPQARSAFVVATTQLPWAQQVARTLSWQHPTGHFYIYHLANTTDAAHRSAWHPLSESLLQTYVGYPEIQTLAQYHSQRATFIRTSSIPLVDIISVDIYQNGHFLRNDLNHTYRRSPVPAISLPYEPVDRRYYEHLPMAYARIDNILVSACMALTLCRHSRP
jgi:hypothetical protein